MTTSTIRWATALCVAGALNTFPALASGTPFPSAARTNAMDETIYRPDCRSDEDYGTRNPCWIKGFAGSRP